MKFKSAMLSDEIVVRSLETSSFFFYKACSLQVNNKLKYIKKLNLQKLTFFYNTPSVLKFPLYFSLDQLNDLINFSLVAINYRKLYILFALNVYTSFKTIINTGFYFNLILYVKQCQSYFGINFTERFLKPKNGSFDKTFNLCK